MKCVLLAEDDPDLRPSLARTLNDHGYVVISDANGFEALAAAQSYKSPINLLLTDFEMPKMNGLELASRIQKERPGIKVLMMSGAVLDNLPGRIDFPLLRKPFGSEELIGQVRTILRDL